MNELSCIIVMLFGAAWARAVPSNPPTVESAEILNTSRRDAARMMFAICPPFPSPAARRIVICHATDIRGEPTLEGGNHRSQPRTTPDALYGPAQQELAAKLHHRLAVI